MTEAIGRALAAEVRPGEVVTLRGDLGAGKTTLVRGAARALGVVDHVTSPTFTLAQTYAGRVPIAHLDAYRLGAVDDEEAGLALAAAGPDAVVFIEWPEALDEVFVPPTFAVELAHAGGDRRDVRIAVADAERERALRVALAAEGVTV